MSKTESSLGSLVGILRFDRPSKSTRTLSATQAYDILSRTQMVLGSFTGKLTDKSAVVKGPSDGLWSVSTTTTDFGDTRVAGAGAKRDGDGMFEYTGGVGPVTLSAMRRGAAVALNSGKTTIPCKGCGANNGITFSGSAPQALRIESASSSNSKAVNANTTYYGAITVGLGEYKKWQGNYAVLKINTVTEKAILRIYAD